MDKLMEDKEFCEKFDKEYQTLCAAEKIAEACGAVLKIDFVPKGKKIKGI